MAKKKAATSTKKKPDPAAVAEAWEQVSHRIKLHHHDADSAGDVASAIRAAVLLELGVEPVQLPDEDA